MKEVFLCMQKALLKSFAPLKLRNYKHIYIIIIKTMHLSSHSVSLGNINLRDNVSFDDMILFPKNGR